jgi:hypothetical protein
MYIFPFGNDARAFVLFVQVFSIDYLDAVSYTDVTRTPLVLSSYLLFLSLLGGKTPYSPTASL